MRILALRQTIGNNLRMFRIFCGTCVLSRFAGVHYSLAGGIEVERLYIMETTNPEKVSPMRDDGAPQLPPIWNIRRNRHIAPVARAGDLEKILERLRKNKRAILHSPPPGGWGATELAVLYAFQNSKRYSMVWWVEGCDHATLRLQFAQLATALRLARGEQEPETPTVEEASDALVTHGGWLLIVHGLQDHVWLDELLPETSSGHVIITEHVAHTSVDSVTLSPLESLSMDSTFPQADDAIKKVGHPLSAKVSESASRAGNTAPNGSGYAITSPQAALRVAINAATNALSTTNKSARDLLALCACYGASEIPLDLFRIDSKDILSKRLADALSEPSGLDTVLAALENKGLLRRDEDSLTIHPAIQESLRSGFDEAHRKAWATAAVRLIFMAFPKRERYFGSINLCSRLVPHAIASLDFARAVEVAPATRAELQHWVGQYLHATLSAEEAYAFFEESVIGSVALYGEDSVAVASRVNSLGVAEMDLGNLQTAKVCFERAYGICERIAGPTQRAVYTNLHESFLTVPIRNLCTVIERLGDYQGAQQTYEKAMQIFLGVHGWNHPLVAECANLFGNSWFRMGKLDKARNCYEKAVAAEEAAAASTPSALASYLFNLGRALVDLQQPEDALPRLEHALRLTRQAKDLPPEERLARLATLGRVLRSLGKKKEAGTVLQEAHDLMEKCEDLDPATRGVVLSQLGGLMIDREEFGLARSYLEESLDINRSLYAADDGRLVRDLNNLGRALTALGAHAQALALFEEALQILDMRGETGSPQEATLRYRMGRCYEEQREFPAALRAYERAQTLDSRATGPRTEAVARDAYAAGGVLAKMGDHVVALGHLTLALDIYEEVLGRDHARTRQARKRLDAMG